MPVCRGAATYMPNLHSYVEGPAVADVDVLYTETTRKPLQVQILWCNLKKNLTYNKLCPIFILQIKEPGHTEKNHYLWSNILF